MEDFLSYLSLYAFLKLESVYSVGSMSRDMDIFVPSARTKEAE